MNIDLILTEWCYRLPKGYPTRSKDYELLYHVILEMTDVTPILARKIVNKAQGLNEQTEPGDQIDFTRLGVSQDMIDQIQDRYDNLSLTADNKYKKYTNK